MPLVLCKCEATLSQVAGLFQQLRHPFDFDLTAVQPGASIPLTPWSKFPLPFPSASPSPAFPSPAPSLPLLLELGPLIVARGSGPSGGSL